MRYTAFTGIERVMNHFLWATVPSNIIKMPFKYSQKRAEIWSEEKLLSRSQSFTTQNHHGTKLLAPENGRTGETRWSAEKVSTVTSNSAAAAQKVRYTKSASIFQGCASDQLAWCDIAVFRNLSTNS